MDRKTASKINDKYTFISTNIALKILSESRDSVILRLDSMSSEDYNDLMNTLLNTDAFDMIGVNKTNEETVFEGFKTSS